MGMKNETVSVGDSRKESDQTRYPLELSDVGAYFSGILLVISLDFILTNVPTRAPPPTFSPIETGLTIVLLGISFGYYSGEIPTAEQRLTKLFILGIFSPFVAFTLLMEGLSSNSFGLLLLALCVFLAFRTGVVQESDIVESRLRQLKNASVFGLTVLWVVNFGTRLLVPFSEWVWGKATILMRVYGNSSSDRQLAIVALLVVVVATSLYVLRLIIQLDD